MSMTKEDMIEVLSEYEIILTLYFYSTSGCIIINAAGLL